MKKRLIIYAILAIAIIIAGIFLMQKQEVDSGSSEQFVLELDKWVQFAKLFEDEHQKIQTLHVSSSIDYICFLKRQNKALIIDSGELKVHEIQDLAGLESFCMEPVKKEIKLRLTKKGEYVFVSR